MAKDLAYYLAIGLKTELDNCLAECRKSSTAENIKILKETFNLMSLYQSFAQEINLTNEYLASREAEIRAIEDRWVI